MNAWEEAGFPDLILANKKKALDVLIAAYNERFQNYQILRDSYHFSVKSLRSILIEMFRRIKDGARFSPVFYRTDLYDPMVPLLIGESSERLWTWEALCADAGIETIADINPPLMSFDSQRFWIQVAAKMLRNMTFHYKIGQFGFLCNGFVVDMYRKVASDSSYSDGNGMTSVTGSPGYEFLFENYAQYNYMGSPRFPVSNSYDVFNLASYTSASKTIYQGNVMDFVKLKFLLNDSELFQRPGIYSSELPEGYEFTGTIPVEYVRREDQESPINYITAPDEEIRTFEVPISGRTLGSASSDVCAFFAAIPESPFSEFQNRTRYDTYYLRKRYYYFDWGEDGNFEF